MLAELDEGLPNAKVVLMFGHVDFTVNYLWYGDFYADSSSLTELCWLTIDEQAAESKRSRCAPSE